MVYETKHKTNLGCVGVTQKAAMRIDSSETETRKLMWENRLFYFSSKNIKGQTEIS